MINARILVCRCFNGSSLLTACFLGPRALSIRLTHSTAGPRAPADFRQGQALLEQAGDDLQPVSFCRLGSGIVFDGSRFMEYPAGLGFISRCWPPGGDGRAGSRRALAVRRGLRQGNNRERMFVSQQPLDADKRERGDSGRQERPVRHPAGLTKR